MAKKSASRSKKARRRPNVALQGAIPRIKLSMPLDASKIRAIQRCIAKGQLTITVNKVDLATGKLGDGWLYD
jgi:hypothetical protein